MVDLVKKGIMVGIPLVASYGVHTVVDNAIKCTTPDDLNRMRKSMVVIGGWVITFIVTDKVAEYVEPRVNLAAEKLKDMKEKRAEKKNMVEEA